MVHIDTTKTHFSGGSYDVGTISLLGGHLALDFVNTIENRTGPHPDDTLRTPDDLRRWGRRLQIADQTASVHNPEAELTAALALRTHLLGLLDALTATGELSRADTAALAGDVADAYLHGTLAATAEATLAWTWDTGALSTVRHTVATAALELLTSSRARHIRRCDGPDCGWYFLDTSKNASRRWCSMRGCGNQAKSRGRRRR
jgi:predicted RNA-binding Zn ribbon-like protein